MANKYRSVLASGGGVQPTGNAQPADVLSGKTFSNADGIDKTGTMVNRGAVSGTATPTQPYTIPAGYHNGSGTVTAPSVAPSNFIIACGLYVGGSGDPRGILLNDNGTISRGASYVAGQAMDCGTGDVRLHGSATINNQMYTLTSTNYDYDVYDADGSKIGTLTHGVTFVVPNTTSSNPSFSCILIKK